MVMFNKSIYQKLAALIAFVLISQLVMAAFTGSAEDKNKANKYSLKNLSKLSKNYSLSSLKTGFLFKGFQDFSQQRLNNGIEVNSMVRMEKGNTTFVYPYKFKVKVPKFKTPVAPNQ